MCFLHRKGVCVHGANCFWQPVKCCVCEQMGGQRCDNLGSDQLLSRVTGVLWLASCYSSAAHARCDLWCLTCSRWRTATQSLSKMQHTLLLYLHVHKSSECTSIISNVLKRSVFTNLLRCFTDVLWLLKAKFTSGLLECHWIILNVSD